MSLYQHAQESVTKAWGNGDEEAAYRIAKSAALHLGLNVNTMIALAKQETGKKR